MLRKLTFTRESDDEQIKRLGLNIDWDESVKRGSLSKEEVLIAKWYGIYTARQPGSFMARITIPGGVVTSEQARQICQVSENYAQGKLSLTTRQAIQLHWLSLKNLPRMMRDLSAKGMTTFHGCGDVNRNTTACPMAADCSYRRFNVYSYAREISRELANSRDLDNLPRKFKITLSGCGAGCAQPTMNCVGLVAVKNGDDFGFKAIIGGGMGWKAFKGQEVFSFIPRDKIVRFSRAVGLLFRDNGDRFNRAKSRLKFVVHNKGIDYCRDEILKYLKVEGVDTSGFLTKPVVDTGVPHPSRPLVDSTIQTDDKRKVVTVVIPKGELTFHQFNIIADLSEMYGDQRVIVTNRQNFELHGIEPEKVPEVKAAIERMGFPSEGANGLNDVVPCVGTTYCPKAVTQTRTLFDIIQPVIQKEKYDRVREKAIINITGCPNSCSPYRISDVGFRGMRIREELGSVEGYEILIGGDNDTFGQKLGEFKINDCPSVLEEVLDTFVELRKDDEPLADTVRRLGLEPFKKKVYNG